MTRSKWRIVRRRSKWYVFAPWCVIVPSHIARTHTAAIDWLNVLADTHNQPDGQLSFYAEGPQ